MLLPLGVLSSASVIIGLAAGPLFALSQDAADELLDPARYQAIVNVLAEAQ